jgi:hypothetical protein
MAMEITVGSGMVATLVAKPNRTRTPERISKVARKCAVKEGCVKANLVKRSAPMAGSMNLRIPGFEKIRPAAMPVKRMLAGPGDGARKKGMKEFIVPPDPYFRGRT